MAMEAHILEILIKELKKGNWVIFLPWCSDVSYGKQVK